MLDRTIFWCSVTDAFPRVFIDLGLVGSTSGAQVKYFPGASLSASHQSDEFRAKSYSEQLAALHEPSLWEQSKAQNNQSYRFLWLHTFHHPIAIRIDVNANGTSTLATKMASGAGGYAPGTLVRNVTTILSKEQTEWFLGKIEEHKFWQLPSVLDATGTVGVDGTQWIVEGTKDHSYHVVDRWSPQDGDIRAIGLAMLKDLAKLKIKSSEIY